MSDSKSVRAKPPVSPRSRATTATRSAAGVPPRSRARSAPSTYPPNATSTESIAASIVGLMVLAAGKVDTTDKNSLQVKAALADLIAVRFDADN